VGGERDGRERPEEEKTRFKFLVPHFISVFLFFLHLQMYNFRKETIEAIKKNAN
jgi:hypothetical protein